LGEELARVVDVMAHRSPSALGVAGPKGGEDRRVVLG
jgi:hypothetical protein